MKLLSLDKKYIKKCFYILFCPRLFVTLHIEIKKKITMQIKETPVLLLTGYLGSGKTTLVNHILSNEKGIKFAVIVNDIGEVNIDADLIQKGGVEIGRAHV